MDILRVRGGAPLQGEIEVGGSKNIALAILAGALLSEEDILLRNVPDIVDVRIKVDLLRQLGVKAEWDSEGLHLNACEIVTGDVPPGPCRRIRTSFYLLGPLLARIGTATVPLPGGCNIGARPLNFHIRGLKALGAVLSQQEGSYHGVAPKLVGADIYLDFPSAGATQHLMTAAVLAEGSTSIHNCAMEPEVVALADFLNRLGARIQGAGTGTVTVDGVQRLQGGEFRVDADRLQAGTFMLAGAATRGDVTVRGLNPETLHPLVAKMREAGALITEGHDSVRVRQDGRPKPVDVRTMPHPGFPTDMQQPMCAYLTTANGTSVINETIYEARIGHIPELVRMGADVKVDGRTITITGVPGLKPARVTASDLRAGAALVIAALATEGDTEIHELGYIDRGYETIEGVINTLGGDAQRVAIDDPEEARIP